MRTSATYILSLGMLICCLLFTVSASAQETDTASVDINDERETQTIDLDRQLDRSVSGGSMTEMGTYSMPNETQYYHAPFEGQKALDLAVDAYLQEMEDRMGENWYWQFLKAVSPYIKLHLGVNEFNNLQFVDRDNPLWQSYTNDEEIE